jgi:hypothetical protein
MIILRERAALIILPIGWVIGVIADLLDATEQGLVTLYLWLRSGDD